MSTFKPYLNLAIRDYLFYFIYINNYLNIDTYLVTCFIYLRYINLSLAYYITSISLNATFILVLKYL